MAARFAGVVRPGRPPYTLRHPKNLRRMVGEQIPAQVATSTFRARQPEIVEYGPSPPIGARKMAGRSLPGGASTAGVGARRCYDMCRGAALVTGLASHRGRGAAVAGAGRRGGRAGRRRRLSTEIMRNRITADLFYKGSELTVDLSMRAECMHEK